MSSPYKVGDLEDFFKNSQKVKSEPSSESLNKFGEIHKIWMENFRMDFFAEFDKESDACFKLAFGKFFKKSKKKQSEMASLSEDTMEIDNITVSKKKSKKQKKSCMSSEDNAPADTSFASELDNSAVNIKKQANSPSKTPKSASLFDNENVGDRMSKKKKRKLNQQNKSLNESNVDVMDNSIAKKKRKKNNKFRSDDSNVEGAVDTDSKMNLSEANEFDDSVNQTINETSANNMSGLSLSPNGSPKKKKNRKKKQQQPSIMSTPNQNESTNNEEEELDNTTDVVNDISSEKKKKKRKKKLQQINALNQSNNDADDLDESFNVDVKTSPTKGFRQKKRKMSHDTTEIDRFADESSNNQVEDSDDINQNDTIDQEPKKKKKKLTKSIEADNVVNDESEVKSPILSKKEAKLLKKKNKKLKGIIPGLSSDPELTKFSIKSDDMVDGENDSKDDNEEEDSDDAEEKNSFPRMPNKKFIPKEEDSEEKLSRTLFVGNLPTSVDQKIIKDLFKGMGKIESVRIRCAIPPKPSVSQKVANMKHDYHEDATSLKGFVVFKEQEDAEKALSLNGTVFNGNHIRVDKAFAKKQQNANSPFNNKVQEQHDNNNTLFLGNLPYNVDDEILWNTFSGCGTVKGIRVIRDNATGIGKGFAFVEFEDASSIKPALALDGTDINGRPMRVKHTEKKQRNDGPRRFQNDSGPRRFQNQQNRNGGGPPQRRFGFRKFQQNGEQESGPRKSFKKMNNQRRMDQEKKKIASMFKTDDS